MPNRDYNVIGPDGKQHVINGPDNATDAEVIAKAKELFGGTTPAPSSDTTPPAPDKGTVRQEIPFDAGIQAQPHGGILSKAEDWMGNLANDLRHGTGETLPGRIMYGLGAKGTNYGNPQAVGDYVLSPIFGTLQAGQGATQVPQGKILEGGGNIIGGALNAAQIPAGMFPEGAMNQTLGRLPDKVRAGEALGQAAQAANKIPINTAAIRPIIDEAMQMDATGTTAPRLVKLLAKALNNKNPILNLPVGIDYETGRRFSQAAGKLSVSEAMAAKPAMKRQISMLADALNKANSGAATQAGVGDLYRSGMREYKNAMYAQNLMEALMGILKNKAVQTGAGVAGGEVLYRALTK